jgi:phosphoserine phosphatase RsbU/P
MVSLRFYLYIGNTLMAFVDREEISDDLKERALAAAGEGITIADARLPDMPLIFVNPAFEQVTGYSREEAIGYNCRFLQGPDTDPKAAETIRTAIREQRPCVVEILNYRKDGTPFWNRLTITPVYDVDGTVTHYIGIQLDVTARRFAEDRLAAAYRDMQRDLEAAARIQQSLLPGSIPAISGVDIAWSYRPSEELGGDTLNIIRLDDTTIALYLLDVSGHGVPASLLSFTLAHTLSSFPEQSFLFDIIGKKHRPANPATVAARLNQRFQLDLVAPQYFTMFYALIDEQNKLLRCIVAGHPPIVVVRSDGSSELLYANGPPIGVTENIEFVEQNIPLKPGDRVFAYTDGLSEAFSPDGKQLGFERIREAVISSRKEPLKNSVRELELLAEKWTNGDPQDDVSVLAISRLE